MASIELKNIEKSFGTNKVINKFDLKINDGEKIAILGPVGNGKTSLLKTLIGYYQSEPGHVKIDNTDINNIPSEMLREKIAYVPQTVHLFSGSIQDNIIAGLQNVNEPEVIEATKAINAHDFICALAATYNHHDGHCCEYKCVGSKDSCKALPGGKVESRAGGPAGPASPPELPHARAACRYRRTRIVPDETSCKPRQGGRGHGEVLPPPWPRAGAGAW